jgi:hypothetical protein
MQKIFVYISVIVLLVTLLGCGQNKEINGHQYVTYGLFDEGQYKNPDIEYRLIIGNVVWSIILAETIVAPIYFIGFSLYEPIGKADKSLPKRAIR